MKAMQMLQRGPRRRAALRSGSGRGLSVLGVIVMCAVAVRPARSLTVDLDRSGAAESSVDLTVKSIYPVRIQNKVTNRVVGQAYTFAWPTAGPGGFAQGTGLGDTDGAGVMWIWETTRQVYSLSCSATDPNRPCMAVTAVPTEAGEPATDQGTFAVPGRTLQPSSVTATTESLRSSLLSFFSPPTELVRVTSEVRQLTNGQFQYQTRVLNLTGHAIRFDLASGPLGCDLACDEGLTNCGGVCVDLLDDEKNCGSCGNVCAAGDICASGDCVTIPALSVFPGSGPGITAVVPSPQNGETCEFLPNEGPILFTLPYATEPGFDSGSAIPRPSPAGISNMLEAYQEIVVDCHLSPFPSKEVSSQLTACGVDIPKGAVACSGGGFGARGMVNVFVPDPSQPIADVFLSPIDVRVRDESGDGIAQPGERFDLFVTLANAGPTTVRNVRVRLIAPEADLDGDDLDNGDLAPDPIVIDQASATYPDIPGVTTQTESPACGSGTPLTPVTAANATPFTLFIPADHPADTARQMNLEITGQTGETTEVAWSATVHFALGVGNACVAGTGEFDRLEGLLEPLDRLVPEGNAVPIVDRGFRVGSTLPLRLRAFCGETPLTGPDSEAPQIVALARGGAPVDLLSIDLDAGRSNDNSLLFRLEGRQGQWGYDLSTRNLHAGNHVITIQMPNGQNYTAGFVLK